MIWPIPDSVRIPVAAPVLGEPEKALVLQALDETQVSGGRFVGEFERRVADCAGAAHGVAASNGTTALHLAFLALGLKPGDEVIMPSLTFVATANAARYCGARPVFVDVEADTLCVDPLAVERAITDRTVGLVPVHLYGHPANMDAIGEIARRHDLWVVEDAAEALGAKWRGKPVGSSSDAAIFSFYGNKIITTGEGGLITTDDGALADRMRVLRAHGMSTTRRYWHEHVGYNYRLTNLQAALGVAQMGRLPALLERKRAIAARYAERLSGAPLRLPVERPEAYHIYWMFSMLASSETKRDDLAQALAKEGIETRPIFVPIHQLPPYQGDAAAACPVSEEAGACGISLPSGAGLTDAEVDEVAEAVLRHL